MVWNENMVKEWVDSWVAGFPAWVGWVVWSLLGIAGLAVLLLPYWLAKCGARLDRAMCKEGKVTTGLGGLTAWVALGAAVWRGIAPAYALWNRHTELHGAWHDTKHWVIGMDLRTTVQYTFPWGVRTIPEEVGVILDGLRIWWYVPLAGMALVWLMRSWKFRSPVHALADAAGQTGIALAIYWGYGLLLGGYLLQCAARLGAFIAVLVGGVFLFLFMLQTWWNEASGKNRLAEEGRIPSPSTFFGGSGDSGGGVASSPPAGYGVENTDMFNDGLMHRNEWGPDEHWRLVEKSIYGDVYENEKGERKTVEKTDAFGHPTELR